MKEERFLRAMTQIDDQLIQAHAPAPAERSAVPRKHRPLRMVLIAAAVAALLVTAALAAGLFGGWEAFFGKVPDNVTTPVGVSTTSGDYTIALEETIVDEDGAAFLLSLRRTDGGVLEGEPGLYDMWLEIAGEPATMSFSYQDPIRSEDGTTIYQCFQFQHYEKNIETLEGQEIVVSWKGIIDEEWTEEENQALRLETVSLAPLAPVVKQTQVNFPIYADVEDPDFVAAMDVMDATAVTGTLPMTKSGGKGYSLAGGVLSQDGKTLALALYSLGGKYEPVRDGDYLTRWAHIVALTDTRTGERADMDAAVWTSRASYSVGLFELGQPLALEDLPYLEATVEYRIVKYLSDEPFELAFTVTDSGYRVEYALDRQVDMGFAGLNHRYDVHVTALRVSPLRLRIFFDTIESMEKEPSEDTPCKLIYADGREIPLEGGVSLGAVDRPEENHYLTFQTTENILFDPDQAAAIQLGDTRIDLK